jgi:hypothetical protein
MQAKLIRILPLKAVWIASFFLLCTAVVHAQLAGTSSVSASEKSMKQAPKKMIAFANYGEAPRSEFFIGPSLLFNNNSSLGFTAAYTRYFQGNLGATAELSYFSGEADQIKRTQVVAMGGVSYYIQVPALPELSVAPYVMIGLSPSTSKSMRTESNGAVTKGTAFVAALGTAISYEVSPAINAAIRVDLNPTIINGFTNNNIRIGAGIILRSF